MDSSQTIAHASPCAGSEGIDLGLKLAIPTSNTLVIDSHKGSKREPTDNLHWKNAKDISTALCADFIWSYPGVNDSIKAGYENIVFVHASHYSYTDYAWISNSPNARIFYVTNEYNLGEPRTAWMAAKEGRKYTVIANHPASVSKVVKKYVLDWVNVNLNAICFNRESVISNRMIQPSGTVYYGSFRKDRSKYFKKYLSDGLIGVSTHSKNIDKFKQLGVTGPFTKRLSLSNGELAVYKNSLYIEDETTHENYNYLANRFYEALSWGVLPVFDETCLGTLDKSGYRGGFIVRSAKEAAGAIGEIPAEWLKIAEEEKKSALSHIKQIVLSS